MGKSFIYDRANIGYPVDFVKCEILFRLYYIFIIYNVTVTDNKNVM